MTTTVHIGCGAGFANDRPDAALALANDLAGRDGRRFLFFELLAERTLAEAQLRRLNDAQSGYALRLFDFLEPVLETPTPASPSSPTAAPPPHRRRHAPAPAAAGHSSRVGAHRLRTGRRPARQRHRSAAMAARATRRRSGLGQCLQRCRWHRPRWIRAPTSSSAAESPTPARRWAAAPCLRLAGR